MHESIKAMLAQYQCHSVNDYGNALHEIIQEITLLGLWRAKFFEHAAFYGGTALRILYQLDRFSEDLDFSLLRQNRSFDLTTYNEAVKQELSGFGFDVVIKSKTKISETNIKSTTINTNLHQQLLLVNAPGRLTRSLPKGQLIKVKMEVDIDPPGKFNTQAKLLLQPVPFSVNCYQLSDLFATKIHALLCRPWKQRVKGRDWYDFVWYVSHKVSVNLMHLQERLVQSQCWAIDKALNNALLQQLLLEKIDTVNFDNAKQDVIRFIKNVDQLALWSRDFFVEVTKRIKTTRA